MLLTLVLLAQVVTPTPRPTPQNTPRTTVSDPISGAASKIKIRRDVDFSGVRTAPPALARSTVGTPSSDCKKQDVDRFDALVSRFAGLENIADTTARVGLSTPLTQMQQIMADATEVPVPPCAAMAKSLGLEYMASTIQLFQRFQMKQDTKAPTLKASTAYQRYLLEIMVLFP